MAGPNPFDSLSTEDLQKLLGGGGLSFAEQMALATAPRSSSSSSASTSSQDPAQFAENMKLLREQLRESALGREQKTAIDTYLAQLQERNQKFVELKTAQDNLIKVSEQRENARQGDNNRKESARQANLKAAVDQYQTALNLIPAMGQLAIEESKRVSDILQNGGDFLARAFGSRGGTFAGVLQADQINAVTSTIARLRQTIDAALAGGPPDPSTGQFDPGTYQAPELGAFGAQLGAAPTLNVPQAPPQVQAEAPAPAGGGGFAGGDQTSAPVEQGFGQYLTPNYTYGDPSAEGNPGTPTEAVSPGGGSAPVMQADGSSLQAVDGGFVRFLPSGEIVQPNGQTVNERVNTTMPGYSIPGGTAQDRYQNAMESGSRALFTGAGKVLGGIPPMLGTTPLPSWGEVGGFLGKVYGETPGGQKRGFTGFADGGMTREGMFMVGDHPSGMPMGTEEMIVNPPEKDGTPHPIRVMSNPETQQMMQARMGGFSRYATGTGAYYDQNNNEVAGGFGMFGAPGPNTPAGLTYRTSNVTPVPVNNFNTAPNYQTPGSSAPPPVYTNPWAGTFQVHPSVVGKPIPRGIAVGSREHADWLKNGDVTPAAPVAPKVTQEQLVSMARSMSPPALQALFNNRSIPAQTALKSTVPGEDVYLKTPTARQWMALTPEEQKAAQSRYNVEFNAGNGFVPNRIAAQYGSLGSRQRGFVGAAGL